MNTLVIYDSKGNIIAQMGGDALEPVGVPFLWVDVPTGQYVIKVDVSTNPHKAILSDPPRDLVTEKLADLEKRLTNVEGDNIMVLGAMAETYEAVLPFLPAQN